MISAALLSARVWWAALPSGVRWLIAGAALAAVLALAWVIWLNSHDNTVIERHQAKIQQQSAPAREKAAEERADDALRNASLRAERDAAITKAEALEAAKAPEVRATVAPQNRALNCARLREAGMTGSAVYREVCL